MPNYFNLTLDTKAPASPTVDYGNTYLTAVDRYIDISISTTDSDTTGYKMKIWGDLDLANDPNIQDTELNSTWISYNTTKQIRVSDGDGQKTVNVKIRDDVYNESSITSDIITLDTTLPTVIITGSDVNKISKVDGKNQCSFSFTCDSIFQEYKVKVVASGASTHDTGTLIGTANASSNMSGTGNFPADTPVNCIITGSDLETASTGDGIKVIKVFTKDLAGNWSV